MPKERRARSVSRASRYPSSGFSKPKNPLESSDNAKEWEDARCPVCLEHPHNAILLLCGSRDKGCRPFMCDTSYRHSNCFDQFKKPKMVCPLCRQDVKGFQVVESARGFMNAKIRSCSSETCGFSGTYRELRKHAREAHPLVRPSEADPERQRSWTRLEHQREFGDFLSVLGVEANSERFAATIFLVRVTSSSSSGGSSWSGRSGYSPQARFTISRVDT